MTWHLFIASPIRHDTFPIRSHTWRDTLFIASPIRQDTFPIRSHIWRDTCSSQPHMTWHISHQKPHMTWHLFIESPIWRDTCSSQAPYDVTHFPSEAIYDVTLVHRKPHKTWLAIEHHWQHRNGFLHQLLVARDLLCQTDP
jgi:hypothetical protein